ncbi:MAG: acyltransferase [Bacteroidales bacterium]|nr:acyltransferase [Bacteroidales bacterium]
MDLHEFDEIRPYTDEEIAPAMQRLVQSPQLEGVLTYLFPGQSYDLHKERIRGFKTIWDFQKGIMEHAVKKIVKDTSSGFTFDGFKDFAADKGYLYVSNHRDIVLDSALLQLALYTLDFPTTEISFGDNLMSSDFVVDFGKSNKMFKVLRNANPREFYKNSMLLSKYIRLAVTERQSSVWIAQRNGRTKDGFDTTEQGILKMFDMSGSGRFVDDFAELKIVPMSVSYEYEPCDTLKTNELYVSRRQKYVKMPGEDLNSIVTGIMQFKGRIHIVAAPPLTREQIEGVTSTGDRNDRLKAIAQLMDDVIISNYKLWKTNYIAYDLLHQGHSYAGYYSQADVEAFQSYMGYKLSGLEGEKAELEEIFLTIYANSVVNRRRFGF